MRAAIRLAAMLAALALVACASSAPAPGPATQGSVIHIGDDDFDAFDTPPTIEKEFEPVYPEYARRNYIEGMVMVRVTLSAKGKVEEARVVESTNRMFDEPALAAVRQFRFKPARKDGEPVRSRVMIPIHFRL